jgi:hypothetical protein
MNARQSLLAVALVATLGASWWVSTREDEAAAPAVVQPVKKGARPAATGGEPVRARPAAAAAGSAPRLDALAVQRAPWPERADGIARIVSFAPPPPPPTTFRPAPAAPPLPFRFVGAIDDAQGKAVFLLEGNQVRMARIGDAIAGQYRLERITPAAIEFTYLPLNTKQTLSRQSP